MTGGQVPVLWITGPAGVGKSTVSWQLFTELAGSGTRVAFADADQLCICYPPPPDDPGRDLVRARNAGVVARNYRAAGARCVIVNGVVDPVLGVRQDLMGHAAVTVCRLRADADEVVRRFTRRRPRGDGDLGTAVRQVREDCDRMDAGGFADVCVDTTGMPAVRVARLVRDRCRDWAGFSEVAREQHGAEPPDLGGTASGGGMVSGGGTVSGARTVSGGGTVSGASGTALLLCGPAGVGKSTIGFQLYLRCLRAGLTAGYIDLDQIGMLKPPAGGDPGGHRLKAANLAAIWRTYHAAGATHLVMTGPAADQAALDTYAAALPAVAITVCRLHAGPAELTRRIMTRGDGGSWPQPGDPLRGQPASYLSRAAERAAADAQALDRAGLGAMRIDTDRLTASQVTALTAAAAGWPGQQRGPRTYPALPP